MNNYTSDDAVHQPIVTGANLDHRQPGMSSTHVVSDVPQTCIDAAKYYRDKLGWAVHPLNGPNEGKGKEPGKKPKLKGYPKWTWQQATDQMLGEYFSGDSVSNLGVVVRPPFVVVDLDSKVDQGASVKAWLERQPHLAPVPRERTANGAHLHFVCHDLPAFKKANGKPHVGVISAAIEPQVNAELFFDGNNIVVSPSVHPTGVRYEWVVTGPLPEVSWEDLKRWFKFIEPNASSNGSAAAKKPGRPRKQPPWWTSYKGDLGTLDIIKLFQELNRYGRPLSADDRKHSVKCPWSDLHGDQGCDWTSDDSGAVVYEANGEKWPGFKCLHQQHGVKSLADVLAWAEEQKKGVVDSCCAKERVWVPGQKAKGGRPRVLLPGLGRLVSDFAIEIGRHLAPAGRLFRFSGEVIRIQEAADTWRSDAGLTLHPLTPAETVSEVETTIETGIKVEDEAGDWVFTPKSMTETDGKLLLVAQQFCNQLPVIRRILDVQIPILNPEGRIVLPQPGYDPIFGTFLDPSAPQLVLMSLDEAKTLLLDEVLGTEADGGFCWKDEQSRVHALARLITPLCRGLMGWKRPPLWIFLANRERCGKDYLAQICILIYIGKQVICAPLDKGSDEEMRKRLTALLRAGARYVHFANMKGHVRFSALEAATDNSGVWEDRILGHSTNISLPNEADFSFSANVGTSWEPDIEARSRRITLHFAAEDVNGRRFKHDLHKFIQSNRPRLLGAVWTLINEWDRQGRPDGLTRFSSFPEWARVVGGVMVSCGLGDPCLPHTDPPPATGDQTTEDVRQLFILAHKKFEERFVEKKEIYELVEGEDADGLFGWIDLADRGGQTKLGKLLQRYDGRELSGITLNIDKRAAGRSRFQFKGSGPRDVNIVNLVNLPSLGKLENNNSNQEGGDQDGINNGAQDGPEEVNEVHKVHSNHSGHPMIVQDVRGLDAVISAVNSAKVVALDIETFGPGRNDALDPWAGDIRMLSLAVGGSPPFLIDLQAIGYDQPGLWTALQQAEVVCHNLKFDTLFLLVKCDVRLNRVWDTMTASRLLNAGKDAKNDLKTCLSCHLKVELAKELGTSHWGVKTLSEEQLKYCADDVIHLLDLRDALQLALSAAGLDDVAGLEMELLPAVVDMEARGFCVDLEAFENIGQNATAEMKAAEAQFSEQAGTQINLNSPQQVLDVLKANGLKLEDTNKETLAGIQHPLVEALLAYRRADGVRKQVKTLRDTTGPDGRLHSSFEPTGTDTGRFSSKEPNLQNVSRGEIRSCFIASSDCKLIIADYSQIELRAAAAIAGETAMIQAYEQGEDLHRKTAAAVLGKSVDQVTKEDRQLAKAVNFGLLYGQSAEGLVDYARKNYGVPLPLQQARAIHQRFFQAYPKLRAWHDAAWKKAKSGSRESRTRKGRRRILPSGHGRQEWKRFTGLVNTPVQGGCADGIKLAIIEIARALPAEAGIVSTVHDELIIEAPDACAEEAKQIVESKMVAAMREIFPEVPITVEVTVASTWTKD